MYALSISTRRKFVIFNKAKLEIMKLIGENKLL